MREAILHDLKWGLALIFITSCIAFPLGYYQEQRELKAFSLGYSTVQVIEVHACTTEDALNWWAGKEGLDKARKNICSTDTPKAPKSKIKAKK